MDEGLGDLGTGLQNLATGIQNKETRLAKAEKRLNDRRNSVERVRAGSDFQQFSSETFNEFDTARDFSKEKDMIEFGQTIDQRSQELIEAYRGTGAGEEDVLRLEERLLGVTQEWTDKAGTAAVKAQDALVQKHSDDIISDAVAQVRAGKSVGQIVDDAQARFDIEKDSRRPAEMIDFRKDLMARVYGSKLENLFGKGDIDAVEDDLEDPVVQRAIGGKAQQKAYDRIDKVRTERRNGKVTTLSQEEIVGDLNLPAGTLVQRDGRGKLTVVFKPTTDGTQRQLEIESITRQREELGDTPEQAEDFAEKRVDGNLAIVVDPAGNIVRSIDQITGEVRELSVLPSEEGAEPIEVEDPPAPTMFELLQQGPVTGPLATAQELGGRILNIIPGVSIGTTTTERRQQFRSNKRGLVQSEILNKRFPVAAIKALKKEISIEPAVFDNPRSLISRLKGIDTVMARRIRDERRRASDTRFSQEQRNNSRLAADMMQNFRDSLGIPAGVPLEALVQSVGEPPIGIPRGSIRASENGQLRVHEGRPVWITPDGSAVMPKQRVAN